MTTTITPMTTTMTTTTTTTTTTMITTTTTTTTSTIINYYSSIFFWSCWAYHISTWRIIPPSKWVASSPGYIFNFWAYPICKGLRYKPTKKKKRLPYCRSSLLRVNPHVCETCQVTSPVLFFCWLNAMFHWQITVKITYVIVSHSGS